MIIGIIGDTHDHLDRLQRAIGVFERLGIDALVHAGDYVSPFAVPYLGKLNVPVFGVLGNNDGDREALEAQFKAINGTLLGTEGTLEIGGNKVYVRHRPLSDSEFAAPELANTLVICGHTHRTEYRHALASPQHTALVNPGECCGWLTGAATLAAYKFEAKMAKIIEIA